MSVPKVSNLHQCQKWIDICSSFGDVDYQKRCWFRTESPKEGEKYEISSFEDDFTKMDSAWEYFSESKPTLYLNDVCNALIQQLVEKLYKYNSDPETYLNPADEDELLNDPKWIEIIQCAQKTKTALEQFKKELSDV